MNAPHVITCPSIEELVAATGLTESGARRRINNYLRGTLKEWQLWAKAGRMPHTDNLPSADEIMAAVPGLTRNGAASRLKRVRLGINTPDTLFRSREEYQRRDTRPKTVWDDLGLGPRKKIEDIPGPTDAELRMHGVTRLPRKRRLAPPSATDLAETICLRIDSARARIARYNAGEITYEQLTSPKRGRGREKNGRVIKLMAATGLSEDGARKRLALYEAGMMDVEDLFAPALSTRPKGRTTCG